MSSYDVEDVFDDIYGEELPSAVPQHEAVAQSAQAIISRAERMRLAPPPMVIAVLGNDSTLWTFAHGDSVLGYTAADDHPLFASIRNRFATALPVSKAVRLDTAETYATFRDQRRAPYVKHLQARLADLDAAYSGDDDDESNPFDDDDSVRINTTVLGDAVVQSFGEVVHGGRRVPLSLPPWAAGKVDAWQDATEVLCTVRLPGPDGQVRLATTGTPVKACVEEMLGYACDVNADIDHVMVLGVELASTIGGGALVPQLCRAAPALLARPEAASGSSFVGLMVPQSDPTMAAAMVLLQRCQRGDELAHNELSAMLPSHQELFEDARERLVIAQEVKSRRTS